MKSLLERFKPRIALCLVVVFVASVMSPLLGIAAAFGVLITFNFTFFDGIDWRHRRRGCLGDQIGFLKVFSVYLVIFLGEGIAGEGLIVTAGGLDTHIHFISPQQIRAALAGGVTTMVGGGTGPADGTNATTCNPGAFHLSRMIEAAEARPINIAYFGKGNDSSPEPLREQIRAGAAGLKIHEDWGATPAVIDTALGVAEETDT